MHRESRSRAEVQERDGNMDNYANRDFIDGYLRKIQECKGTDSHYTTKHLEGNAINFYGPGTNPVRTVAMWSLYIAASDPEGMQARVQQEIDSVVGRRRTPAWEDRVNMPYTKASILETMRWRTPTPLSLQRAAASDTTIGGYHIPAGTLVVPNMWSLNNNPKEWTNPSRFDPTRFLTADSKKVDEKPLSFIPFSVGRRACPGEALSLIEVFLYLTTVLQKFKVLPEEGKTVCLDVKHGLLSLSLRAADLKLLQADKEGGFVLAPTTVYKEKADAAVTENFQVANVKPSKVKATASKLCEEAGLQKLASSVRAARGVNLSVFFSAKTHKPEVPFRVIVSEQGTWQRLVGRYLQRSLSVLPVEDPCLIRKPQIVSEFLQQECPSEVSFFSVDVKDLYYSLPLDQVYAEGETKRNVGGQTRNPDSAHSYIAKSSTGPRDRTHNLDYDEEILSPAWRSMLDMAGFNKLRLGCKDVVALNDLESIREGLSNPDLLYRPGRFHLSLPGDKSFLHNSRFLSTVDFLPAIRAIATYIPNTKTYITNNLFNDFTQLVSAGRDTVIGGYRIPAGTLVVPNLWSLHNDPAHWVDPSKYDPTRFLNADGTMVNEKPQAFAPFSLGRRACPGESLALMEIFLYVTIVLQKFKVLPEQGATLSLDVQLVLVAAPNDEQGLRFIPR
ncbi:hypothetical protein HPB51_017056 [Rhipicephalus microplus]|uniref:Cytochrome n=1 Tax=Rhipicephalus microplus TaxID=6941 RepID=A0A9J6F4J1_RHIMP|nr:hypothetical protein HPB51_017056 [Rhipicephalus microplus]